MEFIKEENFKFKDVYYFIRNNVLYKISSNNEEGCTDGNKLITNKANKDKLTIELTFKNEKDDTASLLYYVNLESMLNVGDNIDIKDGVINGDIKLHSCNGEDISIFVKFKQQYEEQLLSNLGDNFIRERYDYYYNQLPIIFRFNEDIKNNKKYKLNINSDYYLYNVKPDVYIIPLTDNDLNEKLIEQCKKVAKTAANNFLKKSKKQVKSLTISIDDR